MRALLLSLGRRGLYHAPAALRVGLTLLVMAIVLVALLLAARIPRVLGGAGISVITQTMGLILASFSVQQMIDGVLEVLNAAVH